MANSKHPLVGDWRGRVRSRLQEFGLPDFTSFLAQHPGVPYTNVADRLGREVAAPIHLFALQFEEARAAGGTRRAAMDSLARHINDNMEEGWSWNTGYPTDDEATKRKLFLLAKTFAFWVGSLDPRIPTPPALKELARATWKAVVESNPAIGWLPSGPDDPVLVAAFERLWPADATW